MSDQGPEREVLLEHLNSQVAEDVAEEVGAGARGGEVRAGTGAGRRAPTTFGALLTVTAAAASIASATRMPADGLEEPADLPVSITARLRLPAAR